MPGLAAPLVVWSKAIPDQARDRCLAGLLVETAKPGQNPLPRPPGAAPINAPAGEAASTFGVEGESRRREVRWSCWCQAGRRPSSSKVQVVRSDTRRSPAVVPHAVVLGNRTKVELPGQARSGHLTHATDVADMQDAGARAVLGPGPQPAAVGFVNMTEETLTEG